MGIKKLNAYFKKYCSSAIHSIQLEELENKTLVFDTSIFLYRFLEEDKLIVNMFHLITQCLKYKITPIFVFDGKASPLKLELLYERVEKKRLALDKYYLLKEEYEHTISESEKKELLSKMVDCKKRSLRVKEEDLKQVKSLMDAMGVYYHQALQEADVVCSYFVNTGRAWACVSDDMDMFVYGCNRVIRCWNMKQDVAYMYTTDTIITDTSVDKNYFKAVLLLLGTDYKYEMCKNEQVGAEDAFAWYQEYTKECNGTVPQTLCTEAFYTWLETKQYISALNRIKLTDIIPLFEIPKSMSIKNENVGPPRFLNMKLMQKILNPCGIVFV